MTLKKSVLLFWHNLKSKVIKTFKRLGGKKDKKNKKAEKIKNTRKTVKAPIKPWSTTLYISGNKIKRCFGDRVENVISPGDWVNYLATAGASGGKMVVMSGHVVTKKYKNKTVMVKTTKPYSVQSLPDMPAAIRCPGVIMTETHFYVMGGWQYSKYIYFPYKSVVMSRFCLKSNQWESCPPMLKSAIAPIAFLHDTYLYVIGGNSFSRAQRYHLKSEEWSLMKDLPHYVDHFNATPEVFKGRITIATREHMMQYDQDTDEWTVKTFKDLKKTPVLTVLDGQLCASVPISGGRGKFAQKVYDQEENAWLDNE